MPQQIHWKDGVSDGVIDLAEKILLAGGGAIVTPTKVGYIIQTDNRRGLDRKFDLKERNPNKPGVVLCSSVEQLEQLAQLTPEILQLYKNCDAKDILLGCILPWKAGAPHVYIPNDGSIELVQDKRKTSCFVIRFGVPSQQVCERMWKKHGKLVFASSANPSGKGNRGQLQGVGERILTGVDLLVEADDYVHAQQPDKTEQDRMAQGVMVSFVDDEGRLHDKAPKIIRFGLDLPRIQAELKEVFGSYVNAHGSYW